MKIKSILCLIFISLLGACSKPDPTIIFGNWRAESFRFEGLKLPIAPSFEVTRNELILKSPDGVPFQTLPLTVVRARGKQLSLSFGMASV